MWIFYGHINDTAGRTLDFELDPAAGTLTVRLDGAPYHVFTGLGGEAWCPVISLRGQGEAVEVLPFSPSRAYPAAALALPAPGTSPLARCAVCSVCCGCLSVFARL